MSEKKAEHSLSFVKYALIIVLIVASITAGILIALKLHRNAAPKNDKDAVSSDATNAPEKTDDIDETPENELSLLELEFTPPEGSKQYNIIIDQSNLNEYPDKIPETIAIAPDGTAYFTIIIEVVPTKYFIDSKDNIKGSFYVTLRHRCSTAEEGSDAIRLSTKDILMTVDCDSQDRELLVERINKKSGTNSILKEEFKPLLDLLGDGLVYNFTSRSWNKRLFVLDTTVNYMTVIVHDSDGLLTEFDKSYATDTAPDIEEFRWNYDDNGTMIYRSTKTSSESIEKFFEERKLARELKYTNLDKIYTETIYNYDVTTVHRYSKDGSFDSISQTYLTRTDLFYKSETSEERGDRGTNYYEIDYYYTDESKTNYYAARRSSRSISNNGYWETMVTEYNTEEKPVDSQEEKSDGSYAEGTVEYTENGSENFYKSNSGPYSIKPEDGVVYYQHIIYGTSGETLYFEEKIPATGQYYQYEYGPVSKTVERIYEVNGVDGYPIENPKRCATYYAIKDNMYVIEKVVPITYVNGEWIEG